MPDADALRIIRAGAERVVTVNDDAILAAMAHMFTDTHNVAEGAGAAPLAALLDERDAMAGKKVGLVLSGAIPTRRCSNGRSRPDKKRASGTLRPDGSR